MSIEKGNQKDFSQLKTEAELSEYLVREYCHDKYCHYTSLGNIDKILESRTFWVSPVQKLNDKNDRKQFGDRPCFSLCFSTGTSENLSLWYMYSGMDGKGGCLLFSSAIVRKLITNGRYELWAFEGNQERKIRDLIPNEDCSIQFKDVLYFSDKKGKISLRYNTRINHGNVPAEEFARFSKKYKGFLKDSIWYAEKETRLVVELFEPIDQNFDSKEINYKVLLNFDHINSRNIKIKLAPEIEDVSEISDKKYIKKHLEETSYVQCSEHRGNIEMRLCRSCDYKKRKQEEKK